MWFFFVTLYTPFGLFLYRMLFFTFTSRPRGVPFGSGLAGGLLLLAVLPVTFICIKSFWVFFFVQFIS